MVKQIRETLRFGDHITNTAKVRFIEETQKKLEADGYEMVAGNFHFGCNSTRAVLVSSPMAIGRWTAAFIKNPRHGFQPNTEIDEVWAKKGARVVVIDGPDARTLAYLACNCGRAIDALRGGAKYWSFPAPWSDEQKLERIKWLVSQGVESYSLRWATKLLTKTLSSKGPAEPAPQPAPQQQEEDDSMPF